MKYGLTVLASFFGVAALAGLAGWTFYTGSKIGGGWGSLGPVLLFVIGGLVVVGALTGGLMWLAFYSSRQGYDEPYDVNHPPRGKH
ncbi:MAG: hypothetical protein Q7T84_18410 [Phenylobacterium sp.]|uniref:hypothetical protein n=1 Tax=Phenylobacterium sp. TaxID=1871053 RepID=UPI00271D981B|nr:hypothetical protein [Phenylobacterium sp.]MDO9433271.1 hypothetical protein [Phenylobacterium sp.]